MMQSCLSVDQKGNNLYKSCWVVPPKCTGTTKYVKCIGSSKIPFALFPLHDRRAGQTFLQRVVLLYCTVPGAIQKKYYLWICENELLFKVGSIILTVIVVYREKQSCCKERERRRVSLCHLVISVTIFL